MDCEHPVQSGYFQKQGLGPLIHRGQLTPYNCVFIFMDHQVHFAFTINSADGKGLVKNVVDLAKMARVHGIPTLLTTVGAESFGGPILSELSDIFPEEELIDRVTMSLWEDDRILSAVERIGRYKLVVSGLGTGFCVAPTVIQAVERGYQVYLVVDACGDLSFQAHTKAIQRMVEAGAVPVTWLQVFLELKGSLVSQETYDVFVRIAEEHARSYGLDKSLDLIGSQSRWAKRQTRSI